MSQRSYSVYLQGGAVFNVKAARFEAGPEGIFFYDEDGQPLPDTYIDPKAVLAVLPPRPSTAHHAAGFVPKTPS